MRTSTWIKALACFAFLGLWPAAGGSAAELSNADAQKLANWVNMIRDAKTDAEAIKAQKGLVEDYQELDKKGGDVISYAAKAASLAAPLLSKGFGDDVTARVKEINLAIALSQMPQVSIQPALEAMVAAKDPAVRYYGWKGYLAVREKVFLQGVPSTKTAMASLAAAARTETSAAVLEQIFDMLRIDPAMPDSDVAGIVRDETLKALLANWRAWCQRVVSGDAELAEKCPKAVGALLSHAKMVEKDKAQKTALLQDLVDMAFCAAKGFVRVKNLGQSGEAYSGLLTECEQTINAVTGAGKDFIRKPLADPKVATTPDMVLFSPDNPNYGVTAWADFLKDQGIKTPKYTATSAPAGGPTSAPATMKAR